MKALFVSLTCFSLLSLTGCYSDRVEKAIGEFDTVTQQSIGTIQKFYQEINDFQRTLYFDQLRFDPEQSMDEIKRGHATGLVKRFSDDDIKVRLLTLSILSKYTEGIAALASSDAPQQAENKIEVLGSNLNNLNQDFQSLVHQSGAGDVSQYIGPITTLTGIATKTWLSHQRDKALKTALTEGTPLVNSLFGLLKRDLTLLLNDVYQLGESENLNAYMNYYNGHFRCKPLKCSSKNSQNSQKSQIQKAGLCKTETEEEKEARCAPLVIDPNRLAFLKESNATATRLASFDSISPLGSLEKMQQVYTDLVSCADQASKQPQSYEQLVNDLNAYANEVKRVTDALGTFHEASRPK